MTVEHVQIGLEIAFVLIAILAVTIHLMRPGVSEPPPKEPLPADFESWWNMHRKQAYMGEKLACLAAWNAGQAALNNERRA